MIQHKAVSSLIDRWNTSHMTCISPVVNIVMSQHCDVTMTFTCMTYTCMTYISDICRCQQWQATRKWSLNSWSMGFLICITRLVKYIFHLYIVQSHAKYKIHISSTCFFCMLPCILSLDPVSSLGLRPQEDTGSQDRILGSIQKKQVDTILL